MVWANNRGNRLSYKVHKLGNNVVTTIPLRALNINPGKTVRYTIKDNRVKVVKDVATSNIESTISETIEHYNELLTELVDL
ncbi:hypothetical protein GCM10025886_13280 [Tetragenococcus halophilus subsp. flandriensis]|uniref:hypothetical protein n=1 Tax=Tetragenococcus halophilus TaxID=51669 RepID=UPI0023EA3207|nr:hypothetical protein [Tetragenococcus halophilus]GMA08177.1 hypothetical protein GCM10025886_13280 [Tetragenococcus halophilus subsp. flandriensis]